MSETLRGPTGADGLSAKQNQYRNKSNGNLTPENTEGVGKQNISD